MKIKIHFSTIMVLSISLTVIVTMLTLGWNLKKVLTMWGDNLQVTVYLSEDLSSEQIDELLATFKNQTSVGKVQYVSKEQALDGFKKQMQSYAPEIMAESQLLSVIPASFELTLKSDFEPNQQYLEIQNLAGFAKTLGGVQDVSFGQDWIKNFTSFLQAINWLGIILISTISIGSCYMIVNSISESIQKRREEIEVLELVGATKKYIRLPFVIEGLLLGLVSGIIATTFGFLFFQIVKQTLFQELALLQLASQISYLTPKQLMLFVVSTTGLAAICSYLVVFKVNRGWSSSLRLARILK